MGASFVSTVVTRRRALPARPLISGIDAGPGDANGRTSLTQRYSCPMSRLDRVTSDPDICHGQPTIRGLRYPVETVLEWLSSGMTVDEVLEDYPDLERDDVLAALEFGALVAGRSRTVPLGAA